MSLWEIHALKYANRNARTRADSFTVDETPDQPHAMDYYIWLLRQGERVILVDTGYDEAEGSARQRPIRMDARTALAPMGLTPEDITEVIVTHLHYDHAGGLHLFPNAKLHMQAVEMAFATGPQMCCDGQRAAYTADHVCEAIKRLYSGKVAFHQGEAQIAEGVTVHHIGGHTAGLQCVRVRTQAGWMVLASDAAHFYENLFARKIFPIRSDEGEVLAGYDTMLSLASTPNLIVPGHDPVVRSIYPSGPAAFIHRLDMGPIKDIPR